MYTTYCVIDCGLGSMSQYLASMCWTQRHIIQVEWKEKGVIIRIDLAGRRRENRGRGR